MSLSFLIRFHSKKKLKLRRRYTCCSNWLTPPGKKKSNTNFNFHKPQPNRIKKYRWKKKKTCTINHHNHRFPSRSKSLKLEAVSIIINIWAVITIMRVVTGSNTRSNKIQWIKKEKSKGEIYLNSPNEEIERLRRPFFAHFLNNLANIHNRTHPNSTPNPQNLCFWFPGKEKEMNFFLETDSWE